MIYFDNAATGGHKPDSVVNAATAALKFCANPGRSGHRLSLACLERVYVCRKLVCDFLGGYGYERTVFTKNCTEALNIALRGVLKGGDEVVTTVAEHNSVLRPLEQLKKEGVKVKYAPLKDGRIDTDGIIKLVTPQTRAVVVTLASNVTGIAPDIVGIKAKLPQDTLLICDGAQACGHTAVNMEKLGIDMLAVAGHKGMLAIQGGSALLFSERVTPEPVLFGGTGSESYKLDMPDFYPDKLESGTLSYPAIVSLGEGVMYLREHMEEHIKKTTAMTSYIIDRLSSTVGVKLYSEPNPYGIVAFSLQSMQSEMAAFRLSDEYSICVRGGLHCAPLMHKALNSDGLIRASLSPFNSEAECERFVYAVKKIAT